MTLNPNYQSAKEKEKINHNEDKESKQSRTDTAVRISSKGL